MKIFFCLLFLSVSALAQLGPAILDGRCGKTILKIQNNIIRAEFPKESGPKICTFKPVNGNFTDMPLANAAINLVVATCDGKLNGAPGFEMGNISPNAILQIIPKGSSGSGVFSVYSNQDAQACQFKVLDWKQLKKMVAGK